MTLKMCIIPVTPFEQNCSLLICTETRQAAVVDPGGDLDRVIAAIGEFGVDVKQVLVTHGHVDHCSAAAELAETLQVPILGPHSDDAFWIDSLAEQAKRFGFSHLGRSFVPQTWLKDGDHVQIGNQILEVIHCPGHTPGHVVFVDLESRLAAVGDVLFAGSIGRTDFPKGNHQDLIDSIQNKLLPLGDDITFIPGHGPTSTFGYERQHNPFLKD
jgi:glyoxylase-like metal-dependent hydrolase (beta-lactamase superfamily II)